MNVVQILTREHAGLTCLLDALERARPENREQRREDFVRAVLAHLSLEEVVLRSELAQLGDSAFAREADRADELDDALESAARALEPVGDGIDWVLRLRAVRQAFEAHVRHALETVFPIAREQISETELVHLGEELESLRASLTPRSSARVAVRT